MANEKFRFIAPFDFVTPTETVAYEKGYEGPLPAAHREAAQAKGAIEPAGKAPEKAAGGE